MSDGFYSIPKKRNIANMTPEEYGEFSEGFGLKRRDRRIRNRPGRQRSEFEETYERAQEPPPEGRKYYLDSQWMPPDYRDFSEEVLEVQRLLNQVLPYEIEEDGYYGDETAKAVTEALGLTNFTDLYQGRKVPTGALNNWWTLADVEEE